MTKRCRESDSDGTTTAYNPVFVDTSLDTHLVMIVSDADTFSDLKKKIMFEHPQCFPKIGEIKIHALKVKRKGYFYHLSDSMLVKSAFEGVKRNWFLSVDASSLEEHSKNQHSCEPDATNELSLLCITNNPFGDRCNLLPDDPSKRLSVIHESSLQQPVGIQCAEQKVPNADQSSPRDSCREVSKYTKMEVKHITDDHCKTLSFDANRSSDLEVLEKYDVISEGNKVEMPENSAEDKQESRNATSDGSFSELLGDNRLRNSSGSVKRKRNRKQKGKKNSSIPHDQVATVMPSSVQDVREDRSIKEHVVINHMDLGIVSDAAIVRGLGVQHETLSKPSGISQKEKPSEPVQDMVEGNKVSCSSIGTDICESDSGNVKGKSDAPELAAGFKVEGTKCSQKHHATNVKEFPALVIKGPHKLSMDVSHSAHENIVPDDHEFETNQTDKIEEERELSMNHDLEVMLSERCKPFYRGEADVNVKEPVLSAKLSDANGVMESGKSGGSTRKKRRSKKSVASKTYASGMEHVNNAVSGYLTAPDSGFNDHSNDETKKDECILSHTERKEVPKQKSIGTSLAGADMGHDNAVGNEAESLPLTQMNRTQENSKNVDEKSRKEVKKNRSFTAKSLPDLTIKEQGNVVESLQLNQTNITQGNAEDMDKKLEKKTKKNQNSAAKSHLDLAIKEQEVIVEELTASNDKMRELDTPPKTTKKTRSVKTTAVNQFTGSELELEKNTGIERGSFHPEQISGNVDSSQVPSSHTLGDNSNERPEAKVDSDKNMEVSKYEGDGINFKHFFVPGPHQNEVVPADKVNKATISDREMKGKEKTEKFVVPSIGTLPGSQNSLKSYENQWGEKKSHVINSSSIQLQESISKDEHNEVMLHSKKKSSKVSGNGVKAPHSHDIGQIKTPQEASRPDVVNGSGTSRPVPTYLKDNGESSAASSSSSSSSSESSGRCHISVQNRKHQSRLDSNRVAVRKVSSKNTGVVVNSSQSKKSLLTTPGVIFRDGSSESSGDENWTVNSNASTRTPSDNSSSSGYSEGGQESSLDSPKDGSYDAKRKEGGGKNIIKSHSSGPKKTMHMILRSSSRFKKAKLTASQSQLGDTESQPVDFVPDSQANL